MPATLSTGTLVAGMATLLRRRGSWAVCRPARDKMLSMNLTYYWNDRAPGQPPIASRARSYGILVQGPVCSSARNSILSMNLTDYWDDIAPDQPPIASRARSYVPVAGLLAYGFGYHCLTG